MNIAPKPPFNLIIAIHNNSPKKGSQAKEKYKKVLMLPDGICFKNATDALNFGRNYAWFFFQRQVVEDLHKSLNLTNYQKSPQMIERVTKDIQKKKVVLFNMSNERRISTIHDETVDNIPFVVTARAQIYKDFYVNADFFVFLLGNFPIKFSHIKKIANRRVLARPRSNKARYRSRSKKTLKQPYAVEFIDYQFCRELILPKTKLTFVSSNFQQQPNYPPRREDDGTEYASL
jgi:hypothetical protein